METNENVGHGHGTFVAGSVRIVDYDVTNNNLLIRGSSAFGTAGFTMDQLITAIQADVNYAAAKTAGIKLPVTTGAIPMVVDFCLIGFGPSNHKDHRIVKEEKNWFNTAAATPNGSSGPYPTYICSAAKVNPNTMVYWPILAVGGVPPEVAGNPWTVSPAASIGSDPNHTGFNFLQLIPTMRAALTNTISKNKTKFPPSIKAIKNAIVYVHCDSGVNRTGAAVSGYLMTYGSNVAAMGVSPSSAPFTLAQAQTAANSAPPSNDTSPAGGTDIPVTEAYCNYIGGNTGFTSLLADCVPLSGTIWP